MTGQEKDHPLFSKLSTSRPPQLKALRAKVASMLRTKGDWSTPFMLSDTDGLYIGRGGAWLYREVSMAILEDQEEAATLDLLLRALSETAVKRNVHLLLHSWETPARQPAVPEVPGVQSRPIDTFMVPSRTVVVGVSLRPATPTGSWRQRALAGAMDGIDELLGEQFPDLGMFDPDRDVVDRALAPFGAAPMSQDTQDHVEYWYTLGSSADVRVNELYDVIQFGAVDFAELVAAQRLDSTKTVSHALLAGGWGSSAVASVRGQLRAAPRKGATNGDDWKFTDVSVVLGRRGKHNPPPWSATLANHRSLHPRFLPLQQLSALDETLPASSNRVAATLKNVRARDLRAAGFTESRRIGDSSGPRVGLASPNYSYPFLLNPFETTEKPVTLLTGAAQSGKSFTAASIAAQVLTSGRRVLYLTAGKIPSAIAQHPEAVVVDASAPGSLNPHRWLPTDAARRLVRLALPHLVPGLVHEDVVRLGRGLAQAASLGDHSIEKALELTDSVRSIAKLRKALLRDPDTAAVLATAMGTVSFDGGPIVVDLPRMSVSPRRGDAAAALLVAVGWSVGGALVVIDGALGELDLPITRALLAEVPDNAGVGVILATRTVLTPGSPILEKTGRILAHAESEPELARIALSLAGVPQDDEHVEWLLRAAPNLEAGTVSRPALAVHKDLFGRHSSCLVGPVPDGELHVLSEEKADSYAPWVGDQTRLEKR